MSDKVKAVVIGAGGGIGKAHCEVINRSDKSQLVAIVDRKEQNRTELSKKYECKAYESIEDLLSDSALELDCVVIATPHPQHADAAVLAFDAGKHVLVEKVFTSTLEDADRILKAQQRSGKKCGTICQRRFLVPSLRVKHAIDEGLIGTPMLGKVLMYGWRADGYYQEKPWRGTWKNEGGGLLLNQAPHQLDLLLWFMGPVEKVWGDWDNVAHKDSIEVEDTVNAIVKFKNGATANIFLTNAMNPGIYCNVHVTGSNCNSVGVETDRGAMFVAGASAAAGVVSKPAQPPTTDIWEIAGEPDHLSEWNEEERAFHYGLEDPLLYYHGQLFDDFFSAILEDREPLVTGEDGRNVVELITAIYMSRNKGNQWIDFPLKPDANGMYDDGRPIEKVVG
jgi:UDP-N-acetyl-2-amino-2-deoxyglucuronate dehydrogenase